MELEVVAAAGGCAGGGGGGGAVVAAAAAIDLSLTSSGDGCGVGGGDGSEDAAVTLTGLACATVVTLTWLVAALPPTSPAARPPLAAAPPPPGEEAADGDLFVIVSRCEEGLLLPFSSSPAFVLPMGPVSPGVREPGALDEIVENASANSLESESDVCVIEVLPPLDSSPSSSS